MGSKKVKLIEKELSKYDVPANLKRRSGKASQLHQLDEINTTLYAESARTSGLGLLLDRYWNEILLFIVLSY